MSPKELRFGIRETDGRHASTWKLWTDPNGSEVYLTCRELGGILKSSLHESGRWHIAFDRQAFEDYAQGAVPSLTNRFVETWPRPVERFPGITVAYRIVTPYSSPTFSAKDTNRKNVKWLPNVPQRKASEVRIFFARAGILDSEWRKHFPADIVDVGSVALENGETVWAIYRVIDLPDFTKLGVGHGYRLKGNTDQQIESAYSEGSPRIICFDEDSDGCRIMYDCAVDPKLIDSLRQKLAAG